MQNTNFDEILIQDSQKNFLTLSKDLENFTYEVISLCRKPKTQNIEIVCAKILKKCVNDLESVRLLVEKDFSIQAATVASSLQEAVGFLCTIEKTEEKAEQFLNPNKEDTAKQVLGLNFSEIASSIDLDLAVRSFHEKQYKRLCQAKHNSPLVINLIQDENYWIRNYTMPNYDSERFGIYVLQASISLVAGAIVSYFESFKPNQITQRQEMKFYSKIASFSLEFQHHEKLNDFMQDLEMSEWLE